MYIKTSKKLISSLFFINLFLPQHLLADDVTWTCLEPFPNLSVCNRVNLKDPNSVKNCAKNDCPETCALQNCKGYNGQYTTAGQASQCSYGIQCGCTGCPCTGYWCPEPKGKNGEQKAK